MKINFSQNGSSQAAQWAMKKQDMIEKAARLKEQRKQNLANTGERAISSQIEQSQALYRTDQQNYQQPSNGYANSHLGYGRQPHPQYSATSQIDYQEQLQQQELERINEVLMNKKYQQPSSQPYYETRDAYKPYPTKGTRESYNSYEQQDFQPKSRNSIPMIQPKPYQPPHQVQQYPINRSHKQLLNDEEQQYQVAVERNQRQKPASSNVKPPPPQQSRRPPMDDRPLDRNKGPGIPDLDENTGPLYLCPQGCGRSFAQKALQKHAKICVKVFQKKRKEFNSQKHRIVDNEQQMHIKMLDKVDKRYQAKTKKKNWKAESQAFRAVVKAARGGKLSMQEQVSVQQMQTNNLIGCPSCGRKFNESAAQRHIPYCQSKARNTKFR